MAYTSELNQEYSCTLRRIAWAPDLPMTVTIKKMILDYATNAIAAARVCVKRKDKTRCHECIFCKRDNCEGSQEL